jgi:cyclopropane-fatty-acyl-phospholipid synthase
MIVGANRWEDAGAGPKALAPTLGPLKRLLRRNDLRRSRRNVAHHYDLRDELYELFLDDYRQYTAAYFREPSNSLEQAQRDKMAHIAAKLYLRPGLKVLDIGSGWGGFAVYLHKVAKVDVVGVTLSEEQLKASRRLANEAGVANNVRFELIDYRKIQGEFDRIVSVGMFEHVGARHYGTYFAKCRSLLKPDGVMLVHTIGVFGQAPSGPDPFTDKWIFPGYNLPSLSQITSASEKAPLIVSDVETLRLHYVPTLLEWLQRTHAAHDRIVEMYDERFFRMWEFYLAGGVVMFEHGAGCNYQVQLIRDRTALPITRDYIAEAEAKYRAAEAKPAPAAKPRSAGRKRAPERSSA